MKLFECTNGYNGQSYARVYVIAEDAEAAKALATEVHKKEAEEYSDPYYDDSYWADVRVTEMCADTSARYVSRIMS